MSRWIFWIVGALLVAGLIVAGLRQGKQLKGQAAFDFELKKFEGGTVKLSDYRGKLVMVDFWATWCGPCRAEMPFLIKLAKEYESKNVAFIAVSQDDPDTAEEDIREFTKDFPKLAPYVAYTTEEVARAYKIEALPTMYLVGPDGKIVAGHRAMMDEDDLREMLEKYRPQ